MIKHKKSRDYLNTKITLSDVITELSRQGYNVEDKEIKGLPNILEITDNRVKGAIKEGFIYIDSKNCFNKYSQCPLILPIPSNNRQFKWLIERMRFWGTNEGIVISNQYLIEFFDKEYPR